MTRAPAHHELFCFRCRRELPADYRYCPHCALPLLDESGQPLTEHEAHFSEEIEHCRERERRAIHLWRPSLSRLALLGALILSVPDLLLLVIFQSRVELDLLGAARFLAMDAMVGLTAVLLVVACGERGVVGDLILITLRLGQIPLLSVLSLRPFPPGEEVLTLLLLGALPVVVTGLANLVFRVHLTDLMDSCSNPSRALTGD